MPVHVHLQASMIPVGVLGKGDWRLTKGVRTESYRRQKLDSFITEFKKGRICVYMNPSKRSHLA